MPETLTIEPRVRKIIAEHLGVDPERVTDDARFAEDFGADSLDMIEVVAGIESEFDIIVSLDEQAACLTVGDLIGVVEAKR
jgi:acyl carrier protein